MVLQYTQLKPLSRLFLTHLYFSSCEDIFSVFTLIMKKYTVRPEHYSFAYSILCRRRRVGHVLCVYPHWPKVLAQVYFVYSLIYPLPLTWHCSQNQTVGTFSKTDVTEAAESPCNNLLSPLGLISVTPDWSLLTKTSSFDIISPWFCLLHLLLFISAPELRVRPISFPAHCQEEKWE